LEGLEAHDFCDRLSTLPEDRPHLPAKLGFDGLVREAKANGKATGVVGRHLEKMPRSILEMESGRARPDPDGTGRQHHVLGDTPNVEVAPTW
jgi:hypothetical protein